MLVRLTLATSVAVFLAQPAASEVSEPPRITKAYAGYPSPKQDYIRDCSNCPPMAAIQVRAGENPLRPAPYTLLVGRYEVTWAEYLRSVDEANCTPPILLNRSRSNPEVEDRARSNPKDERLRDRVAVTGVSLADITCFTSWLSRRTGKRYRLPTSHEWEVAARSGAKTRYPWGDELGFNNAFVDSAFDFRRYPIKGFGGPRSVSNIRETGLLAPNASGLFDVIGNAWELTSTIDNRETDFCRRAGKAPCSRLVVRSGPHEHSAGLSEIRYNFVDQANVTTGFRIVRE